LQLAVERCIGNLQDLLSLGDVRIAAVRAGFRWTCLDLAMTRQIDSVWPSRWLDSPQVQVVLNNRWRRDCARLEETTGFFEIIVADRTAGAATSPFRITTSRTKRGGVKVCA
jgi:hypothetical protein